MAYRAVRNFRIARQIYDIGAPYVGSDIDYLLERGLIEFIPSADAEPLTLIMDQPKIESEIQTPPAEKNGKHKKKKSK